MILTFLLGILSVSCLCFLRLIFSLHIFMLILHFWKACFSSSALGVVLYVAFLHSNYILKSSSFHLWSHVSLRLSISCLVRCVGERGHIQVTVSMGLRRGEQMSLRAEIPRSLRSHNWSSTLNLQGELAWGEGGLCGLCLIWVWERGCRADPTHFHQLFLKIIFFRFTIKLRGRYWDFPYTFCPYTYTYSPITSISHQDETALKHHDYPKPIVYLRVYSWSCIFYGFGQMCNDIYPSL